MKKVTLRISASNSLKVFCRCSGFFASIFNTTRSISGVTFELNWEGAGAGSDRCFFNRSFGVNPANGVRPVNNSKSVTPKL